MVLFCSDVVLETKVLVSRCLEDKNISLGLDLGLDKKSYLQRTFLVSSHFAESQIAESQFAESQIAESYFAEYQIA